MTRTLVWTIYSTGVFIGRLLPAPHPMPLASAECAVTGAALALLMHWAFNRRWRKVTREGV